MTHDKLLGREGGIDATPGGSTGAGWLKYVHAT